MTRTRGRPLGAKALAVLRTVELGPHTISELATGLQLSYRDAVQTVSRLSSAGLVRYGSLQPGQHDRPARLIEPGSGAPVDPFRALTSALTRR